MIAQQIPSPLNRTDVDEIWISVAYDLGFRVERSDAAYASTDGKKTLFIGRADTLDSDDSLAQLIFHELCHALVQGERTWQLPDWGLDNTTGRDDAREMACLKLQAHFADAFGLRAAMTPTTVWRAYYQELPVRPLEECAGDIGGQAGDLAQAASARATGVPVEAVLERALRATAAVVFTPARRGETCGTCAWLYRGGKGPAVERCRQSGPGGGTPDYRTSAATAACERWEAPLACETCGACCREAYHVVSVAMRDPVVWRQPELIVRQGHRFSILREGDRCAALKVAPTGSTPLYTCRIYEDRPQTCRDFERGGANCLIARRRVGLSA